MKKLFLGLSLILLAAVNCHATLIGGFPGLDPLIAEAEAIVVVRIDATNSQIQADGWGTYRCHILQSLKGDIPRGKDISLLLLEGIEPFSDRINVGEVQLVFLHNNGPEGFPSEDYAAIAREGATLTLSPVYDVNMPEGKSVAEQVLNLARKAKDYWIGRQTNEDALLNNFLGAPAVTAPSVAATPDPALSKQIRDLLLESGTLKPGMTRADLLKVFTTEGGVSTPLQRTYVHRRCQWVKVDVEFAPSGPTQGAPLEGRATDTITKISKPYLDWSIID